VYVRSICLEVCSACQNRCVECAHHSLRHADRHYHLSMEALERFIRHTRRSDYRFRELKIHGPGEPTLWKHFDAGVAALRQADLADCLVLETNGKSLDRISRQSWRHLDRVSISLYPEHGEPWLFGAPNFPYDRLREHQDKVRFEFDQTFRVLPRQGHEGCLPAQCDCPGPMLYDDEVFLYCGPPVFDALALMNEEASAFPTIHRPLGEDYLGERVAGPPELEVCRYCWANGRIQLPERPWADEAPTWQVTSRSSEAGPARSSGAGGPPGTAEAPWVFELDDGTTVELTIEARHERVLRWVMDQQGPFTFTGELAASAGLPDADIWTVLDRLERQAIIGRAEPSDQWGRGGAGC
jgi:hypothetical protein